MRDMSHGGSGCGVIASWLGIACALAACASPPDDTPGLTASVRVTGSEFSRLRGEPIAGAGVAFIDRDGVITLTRTDENGLASGPAPDGTTVHVVEPKTNDWYGQLYTVLDVFGGDVIQLGELRYPTYVAYSVRVDFPPPPAGSRLTYIGSTPCLAGSFIDSTSITLRLAPGCEDDTGTVVLTARDETTYDPVGFLVVPGVPLAPDTTITAPSGWRPGTAFTSSFTGFADDAQVRSSLWIRNTYLDFQGVAMVGGAGTGDALYADVPMTGEHYLITEVVIPDVRAGSGMIIDPGDGTHTYQLDGSALLPAIWGSSFDHDARVFRWSSADVTAPVDAVRIRTAFYTPNPDHQDSWRWSVYAAGNRTEVAVPAIPDELFPSDQFQLCCDGRPEVVMVDLEQGSYLDVLRIPDPLASFRENPTASLDADDVAVPRARWRLTWSGLGP